MMDDISKDLELNELMYDRKTLGLIRNKLYNILNKVSFHCDCYDYLIKQKQEVDG